MCRAELSVAVIALAVAPKSAFSRHTNANDLRVTGQRHIISTAEGMSPSASHDWHGSQATVVIREALLKERACSSVAMPEREDLAGCGEN